MAKDENKPQAVLHLDLTIEELADLAAWANEKGEQLGALARHTLMDAVAA